MERKESLRRQVVGLTQKERNILVLLVVAFHVVGIIGFLVPPVFPLFVDMVPFFLVLMLAFVTGSHRPADGYFFLFGAIIFVLGFIIEWIGVHLSWLFGHYTYGYTLGTKLDDIPLCIGVNWILLIYSTGVAMRKTRVRSMIARILTGAATLVILDWFIEPIAVKLNYWHWTFDTIPYGNYITWFFVSVVMLYVFELFHFKKQSVVAPIFLLMQFVFFVALRLGFMWL